MFLRLFFLLALSTSALVAQDPKPVAKPTVDQLAWLAGKWRAMKAGRVTDEQWMAPGAGVMLGMARTIAKGKVLEHEFMQIREGPGGELFYVAQPSGQQTATFKMIEMTAQSVAFENKEHDFPQKITYALLSDGSVVAAIEGPGAGGVTKRIEFSYKRVE